MRIVIDGTYDPLSIFVLLLQHWFITNGLIPFSVKIFLILSRSIQGILLSSKGAVEVKQSLQIDDLAKVKHIIADKTGTLTQNKMELKKIIQRGSSKLIDLDSYVDGKEEEKIDVDFQKALSLCVHQNSDGDFSTHEDKILKEFSTDSLSNALIENIDTRNLLISIRDHQHARDFKYVDHPGLEFTFKRKMSSKLIHFVGDNVFTLYCKGSIDKIKVLLKREEDRN